MARRGLIVYSLWIVIISKVAAYRSESLDLVEQCCSHQCGSLEEPLYINSDGLDKKTEQYSKLRITLVGQKFDEKDPHDSYCMIYVNTLDYAMLNLTYYLENDLADSTVVVSLESNATGRDTGIRDRYYKTFDESTSS